MSAMSDAVKNGPRATAAKTTHIEAQIKLADAKASALQQSANNHARKAKGDGPMAKYHRGQAAVLASAADRRRAEANDLRVDLAKAKADEAARNVKHVKRTVASTADEGLVPKAAGQGRPPSRAKAGQVAKPGQPTGQRQRDPWGDLPITGETVCEAIGRYDGSSPVRPRSTRKETCRWWGHDHGRCPRGPHPHSKDDLCDKHHYQRYGVMPTDARASQDKKGGQPVAKPRKNPPREVTPHPKVRPETHGVLCPCCGGHHGPDYRPAKGEHCGWCHGHGRGGGANFVLAPSKAPSDPPTKGNPAMTVSGEAVNIEQTRANLDQLKGQVTDLRGSFEGISGSLASGGLNQLAGSLASADDSLDSVLTQIGAAEKHLSDQEAIAEAAQAAGEMHTDTAFYG